MSDSDESYHAESSPEPDGDSRATTGGVSTRATSRAGNAELRSATGGGYVWEDSIQRPWDVVQEDEGGSLAGAVADLVQSNKRKRLYYDSTPVQRGIIRHLMLVIDLSNSMTDKDMRPSRYMLSLSYAMQFVADYFEQNPISQLGVIGMRNGLATLISQLGSNPTEHIQALQHLKKKEPSGDPSLQNALEMCRGALYHVPTHGTKEVVIIFGSLLSCDPGDIHKTIATLKAERIRVRVVGLAAEVAVCKELCKQTNDGDVLSTYGVALHEQHFKELLLAACIPPASAKAAANRSGSELMRMGFPSRIVETTPSFCACHSRLSKGGYVCPRCKVKVCSLPTECPACELTLILSTHLARSYHHLMPLRNWDEVKAEDARKTSACFACQRPFPKIEISSDTTSGGEMRIRLSVSQAGVSLKTTDKITTVSTPAANIKVPTGRFRCPDCGQHFCIDCDLFSHEVLHCCPGCESASNMSLQQQSINNQVTNGRTARLSSRTVPAQ
ncbi:Ssl1-like-domain-containing protein [Limtongia smithiae]|uniref:Ssl1-like-domain-containing protein n=1 Tax=Limtongia smithiae TaxID=1125753 RepID=UPI0034CFF67C